MPEPSAPQVALLLEIAAAGGEARYRRPSLRMAYLLHALQRRGLLTLHSNKRARTLLAELTAAGLSRALLEQLHRQNGDP